MVFQARDIVLDPTVGTYVEFYYIEDLEQTSFITLIFPPDPSGDIECIKGLPNHFPMVEDTSFVDFF